MASRRTLWIVWITTTVLGASALAYSLATEQYATVFLAGDTTHGHYQIEMTCSACHTSAFATGQEIQQTCVDCHGDALSASRDTHPASKFSDPREADRMKLVNARMCVTCHQEHQPEKTLAMGLTQPADYCLHCHEDIDTERPSHEGMGFETCASAGCHNYHDNLALYEDFLLTHAEAPDFLAMARVRERVPSDIWQWLKADVQEFKETDLSLSDHPDTSEIHDDWLISAHGEAGIGCTNCHGQGEAWQEKPAVTICQDCHSQEFSDFTQGRHGMRLAVGQSPMTPAEARHPMQEDSAHRELTCVSCHGPHEMDMNFAATQACLGCHADDHSKAFVDSPHHQLWQQALAGERPMTEAVTCATCHMPRESISFEGHDRILVRHNQNRNLRPNEKMIRSVCMDCHGLPFSLQALASPDQILSNFRGMPESLVESIDMAVERRDARDREQQSGLTSGNTGESSSDNE